MPPVRDERPRPAYDRWRDADGTHIPDQCRDKQIAVSKEHGALPSRLHQQGRVVGRGQNRLYVRLDDDGSWFHGSASRASSSSA